MESTAQTLDRFIEEQQITAEAEWADSNPNMDEDWTDGSRHFVVHLRKESGTHAIDVPFTQGSAHTEEPTAADVLDCLASDAAGAENARSFEDWCAEYGYNTDSRSAERTWKLILSQSDDLASFLGTDAYEELLWKVERL